MSKHKHVWVVEAESEGVVYASDTREDAMAWAQRAETKAARSLGEEPGELCWSKWTARNHSWKDSFAGFFVTRVRLGGE